MSDQAYQWSKAAAAYELEFIDPYMLGVRNPLPQALEELADPVKGTAADLGCGVGPLLPTLAKHFRRVIAVDFAEGMLKRAREHCGELPNVEYLHRTLTDLAPLAGQVDVAVAVNSLVLPDVGELEAAITAYIQARNADPKPFRWVKSADDILAAVERFCLRTIAVQDQCA